MRANAASYTTHACQHACERHACQAGAAGHAKGDEPLQAVPVGLKAGSQVAAEFDVAGTFKGRTCQQEGVQESTK